MVRPLRLEFPGAVYHVTARGNARAEIFKDDADRDAFLSVLERCIARFGWLLHAYCLMDNHYHLMIETRAANLSAGMRQLNGVYTQRFNRRHRRVGHVFQGRFKAIIVDRDSYLLDLSRYVVLNPVRARVVHGPKDYRWSSYRATAGLSAAPQYLTCDWILSQFGTSRALAQEHYRAFVAEGMKAPSPWERLEAQVILGDEAFIATLGRNRHDLREVRREQRFLGRPKLGRIFSKTAITERDRRNRAIVDAAMKHGYSQAAIADHLGLHYSSVSKVIKQEMSRDSRFKT
ncbi:MAG: addiction module toxin RelE [Betaproteobacteria bacterium SG8_41]|jgi:putative transposase|nr:MAG: addiction module toxin RelE [Betaproteobacteria bacterium SG8_41]